MLALAMSIAPGAHLASCHNAFDGVRAATLGGWARMWNLLHQQGLCVVGVVRSPGYDRFWTLKFRIFRKSSG